MGKAPKDIIRIMAAECDVPGLLATVDALRTRLAAAEADNAALRARVERADGLLLECRVRGALYVTKETVDLRSRIDAHLDPAKAEPVRCWDRDLCCGDDLCKFQNGETLPPNTYCAHDDKPEGGEDADVR